MSEKKPDNKSEHLNLISDKSTLLSICANFAIVLTAIICAWNLGQQYPLMREFLILFLLSEAAFPCYLLVLHIADGSTENKTYMRGHLFNWLRGKKQKKLLVTRAFFILVLILLLGNRPDYFQANILMLAGIVIILVLLILRIADMFHMQREKSLKNPVFLKRYGDTVDNCAHSRNGMSGSGKPEEGAAPSTGVKKGVKTCTKIVLAVAAFLLYLILGVVISGFRQPEISDEYKENFHVEDFYGAAGNRELTGNPKPVEGGSTAADTGNTNHLNPANGISTATGTDRAVILEDNSEALMERVRMIRNAKERIILSTFDFRADISGKVLLAALLDAAERNVSVKVVVDGVSGLLRMEQNPYFFALSSHPNAEIRIYNRVNPLLPWRLMGRLHDKYLIADETAYILGGRNSFSYFLGEWPGHKNYDRDVLVYNAGQSASSSLYQVEAYFNEIWNLKYTSVFHNSERTGQRTCVKRAAAELKELYAQYLSDYPQAAAPADYEAMTFATAKITLLSNPTTVYAKEPTVFYALTELMKQAKSSVTIHTPYIIANDLMYDAFAEIAAAVPDARMMTNSVANNGNPFGAGDYRANFAKIHATGIGLLEYEGGVSYHGKSIVMDDDLSLVGSFNMDMRSVYLDTELMLVIDSKEVNAQLRGLLARYEDECAIVQEDGTKVFPAGVTPQEVSSKKEFNMKVLYNLLKWARRLL